MSDHPTDFVGSIPEAVTQAIVGKIPDAKVAVDGGGGHFTIDVCSPVFEGMSRLNAQRLVLSAVAPLMKGDRAPVHAVDKLTTRTP